MPELKCRYCSKTYVRTANLENHINTNHADERERTRRLEELRQEAAEREQILADYDQRHTVVLYDSFNPAPRNENPGTVQYTNRASFLPQFIAAKDESDGSEAEIMSLASGRSGLDHENAPRTELHRHAERKETLHETKPEDDLPWLKQENIFSPFAGPKDFVLARYFIKNNITQAAVNEYFNNGLGRSSERDASSNRDNAFEAVSFKSWYELKKKMETLTAESTNCNLEWKTDVVSYGHLSRNKGKNVDYLYRDIAECVQFLLEQPCFEPHLTYEPRKEYTRYGERVYGELDSADWWWRTLVSCKL